MNKWLRNLFLLLFLITFLFIFCFFPEKTINNQQSETHKLTYIFQVGSNNVRIIQEKNNCLEFQYIKLNHSVKIKENRALFDGYFIFETEFSPWHLGTIEVYQYEPYHWHVSYDLHDNKEKTLTFFLYYDSTPWIEGKDAIFDEEVIFEDSKLKWQVLPEIKHKKGWLIEYKNDSYILFPVRFMFELFGYDIQWDPESREILIYSHL